MTSDDLNFVACCPACGEPIDHCPGHGLMGDPAGWTALRLHDHGRHPHCHPFGCDVAEMASRLTAIERHPSTRRWSP